MFVELKNISKSYNTQIIKKLSYSFQSGKIYVIKGVSGCGKTTLLNIIGGIDTNFEGTIETSSDCADISKTTGYIFQNSLLLSNITILENLLLIKNNIEEITKLCDQLNVSDFLQKYPEQLSGGERQRIAIVRALLQVPHILLADEPTASLDEKNSVQIAKTISELRDSSKIIIIATHEHYFDELADEIIYLQYGAISKVEKKHRILETSTPSKTSGGNTIQQKKFSDIKFCLKRKRKLLSFNNLCSFTFVFLLIMIVSTLQNNFGDEYLRFMKDTYPMDMFSISATDLSNFKFKNDIKIYYNYTAEENNIHAYYLLKKKDSVLNIKNMIEFGTFPESNNEILVSKDFIYHYFSDYNYISYLGQKVLFKNIDFVISGILADFDSEKFEYNLFADVYYQRKIQDNSIFIPYDVIKNIGKMQESDFYIAVYDGLSDNIEVLTALNNILIGHPNQFYADIENAQITINFITSILFVIMLLCYIISCIFMISVIQTELFYRKKEVGFLQIFGVNKLRIKKIVSTEYLLKIDVSFFIALMCYVIMILIYYIFFNQLVFFNYVYTGIMICLLFAAYYTTVHFTIKKFLKNSIISLIS